MLTAPAGYGKRTAVAQWAAATDVAVAWLTLDADDGERPAFWAAVLSALDPVAPDAADAARAQTDIDAALTVLVNALVDADPLVLVLDGLHHAGIDAQADVGRLLVHGPEGLRIVATSRRATALPLASLRAHNAVVELGSDELRFSAGETATFLAERRGAMLDPDDLDELLARTEGWPGVLQIAAAADDPAGVSGTSRRVAEFLRAEVLGVHDDDELDLLRCTSVAARLSAPLCDELLDRDDSAALLERLSEVDPAVHPLDERGESYAVHPLVRELLRADLARHESAAGAAELHARAARWFRAEGRIEEAIPHAVGANDPLLASELVASSWYPHALAGDVETVQGWLDAIPAATVRACPRLRLVRMWLLTMLARRDEAAAIIADLRATDDLEAGPLPDGSASVGAQLALVASCFPSGDVGKAVRCGRRALAAETAPSPWRGLAAIGLAVGLFHADEVDEARLVFHEARTAGVASGQAVIVAAALAGLSRIEGLHGRRDEQLRLATEAREALAPMPRWIDNRGEVEVAWAEACAAHGRLAEALGPLERGIAVWREQGQPLHLVDALLVLVRVRLRSGDREGAQVALAEAEAVLATCPDPRATARRAIELRRTVGSIGTVAHTRQELSDRERTVLRMLDSGLSERQIADALYISFNTLHTHVKSIYRKLGVNTRADAVAAARQGPAGLT